MGAYHGEHGFRTFSHQKGAFVFCAVAVMLVTSRVSIAAYLMKDQNLEFVNALRYVRVFAEKACSLFTPVDRDHTCDSLLTRTPNSLGCAGCSSRNPSHVRSFVRALLPALM